MRLVQRHLLVLLGLFIVGVPLVACDEGSAPTPEGTLPPVTTVTPGTDPTGTGTATNTATTPTVTAKPPRNVEGIVVPYRPAYQTKSSAQLRKSVINCFGNNATTVTAGMLVGGPTGAGNVGGAFLSPPFAVGQDMVLVQAGLFDGDLDALKTGVRADQLTLEYLTALRNVANVVGFRCLNGLTEDASLCQCDSVPVAAAMLARCIGDVVSSSTAGFLGLAADLSLTCQGLPASGVPAPGGCVAAPPQPAACQGKGVAVASVVSSLTFAKLP